jgi:hypothetical protein
MDLREMVWMGGGQNWFRITRLEGFSFDGVESPDSAATVLITI